MKTHLYILLCFSTTSIYAQSDNVDNFKVSTTRPLFFAFSNINELFTPKTIHNAIQLQVKAKKHPRNISAHINFTGPGYNTAPTDWVSLKLSYRNATNAVLHVAETKLRPTPALLFSQPGSLQEELYSFSYDVVLNPLTTFVKNGNYNFSITFTMTEP